MLWRNAGEAGSKARGACASFPVPTTAETPCVPDPETSSFLLRVSYLLPLGSPSLTRTWIPLLLSSPSQHTQSAIRLPPTCGACSPHPPPPLQQGSQQHVTRHRFLLAGTLLLGVLTGAWTECVPTQHCDLRLSEPWLIFAQSEGCGAPPF